VALQDEAASGCGERGAAGVAELDRQTISLVTGLIAMIWLPTSVR
jgi:hypothetical protein